MDTKQSGYLVVLIAALALAACERKETTVVAPGDGKNAPSTTIPSTPAPSGASDSSGSSSGTGGSSTGGKSDKPASGTGGAHSSPAGPK